MAARSTANAAGERLPPLGAGAPEPAPAPAPASRVALPLPPVPASLPRGVEPPDADPVDRPLPVRRRRRCRTGDVSCAGCGTLMLDGRPRRCAAACDAAMAAGVGRQWGEGSVSTARRQQHYPISRAKQHHPTANRAKARLPWMPATTQPAQLGHTATMHTHSPAERRSNPPTPHHPAPNRPHLAAPTWLPSCPPVSQSRRSPPHHARRAEGTGKACVCVGQRGACAGAYHPARSQHTTRTDANHGPVAHAAACEHAVGPLQRHTARVSTTCLAATVCCALLRGALRCCKIH